MIPMHRLGPHGLTIHQGKQTDRQSRRAYPTNSRHWRWIRQQVLIRDAYACVMCGHVNESNHVDHEDGDSGNNSMGNLRTLCQPCHARHGKIGVESRSRRLVYA